MCAPKNDLAKIALIGAVAYATGGTSLFSSAGTAIQSGIQAARASSTLQTLASIAKVALPVIGATGQIYSGYITAQLKNQQANFTNYEIDQKKEAFALRKVKRLRAMAQAIGKQRALYGVAGVTLQDTPSDIIGQTASTFAEDQFIDTFNTSQGILSKQFQGEMLRTEAKNSIIGGYTNAAVTLGTRGLFGYGKTEPIEYSNTVTTTQHKALRK